MASDGAHPGDRDTPASPGNQESPSHSPFRLKTYIHAFSTIVLQPVDLYACTAIMYLWSVKVGLEDAMPTSPKPQKPRPAHTERIGAVSASIWPNTTDDGRTFYSTTFERMYRDGNETKNTTSFNHDDLLNVAKVCERAEAWIAAKTAENRTRAAA